eukprot:3938159-Rhodomonas_salina.2
MTEARLGRTSVFLMRSTTTSLSSITACRHRVMSSTSCDHRPPHDVSSTPGTAPRDSLTLAGAARDLEHDGLAADVKHARHFPFVVVQRFAPRLSPPRSALRPRTCCQPS